MNNTYTKKIVTNIFDFDKNMNIKVAALLNYFQDVAGIHADLLKTGRNDLAKRNLCWILAKVTLVIHNKINCGEEIFIKTAPHEAKRIILDRDFLILNNENLVLVEATSKWCIIDYSTRQIKHSNEIKYNLDTYADLAHVYTETIPRELENKITYSHIVKFSDIDFNNHMNNAKYADCVFNAIPLEILDNKNIKKFQINYVNESVYDEQINFSYKQEDNKIFIVGNKINKDLVVQAMIEL